MKVLIVCTGNTCRSPMAVAILRRLALEQGIELQVDSAGTYATEGGSAHPHAIQVMREKGLDIGDHRTKQFTPQLAEEADLILTMTQGNKRDVISRAPGAAGKTFTIAEYTESREEVADPFDGDVGKYRETAAKLESLLRAVVHRLARNS